MLGRAFAIWLGILVLANLNGAFRELLLRPRLGAGLAHMLSTLLLATLVGIIAWLSIRWIGPANQRDGIVIGTLWLALTLMFEFGAGHYLFHKPWAELVADYNLMAGRIWPLVLLVTLAGPEIARRLRAGMPD